MIRLLNEDIKMFRMTPNYMHEFTRIQYSSPDNKLKYSKLLPQIQQVTSGQLDLELTIAGIRPAFITTCAPEFYNDYKQDLLTKHNLYTVAIGKNKINTLGFYGVVQEYQEGEPHVLRVAVTRNEADVEQWKRIAERNLTAEQLDRLTGELLGYPQCCIDSFIQRWVTEESIDPTFDQSVGVDGIEIDNRMAKLPGTDSIVEETWKISLPNTMPFEAHTMLRWVGVRLVPHLPCKFDCQHSLDMARQVYEFRNESMHKEVIEEIYQMQQWPVEWSVMHGIVELYTPCFRVFTRGDCAIDKYLVEKHSEFFPEGGSRGAKFPFKTKKNKVSESKSFKLSLVDSSEWEENGYMNKESMDLAHDLMLQVARDAQLPRGDVLDLGCGNGIFAEKLHKIIIEQHNDQLASLPCGVELIEHRFKSAIDRLYYGKVWWADMFAQNTWEAEQYSVITLMPFRLLEHRVQSDIDALKAGLTKSSTHLLLYLTSDIMDQTTLDSVVKDTGLDVEWEPCSELLTNSEVCVQLFKKRG